MNALWQKVRALPRAGIWLLCLALFVGVYFGVIDPVLGTINRMNAEADALQDRIRERAAIAQKVNTTTGLLQQSIQAFGSPEPPAEDVPRLSPMDFADDATAAIERRIDEVFDKHQVFAATRTVKDAEPLLKTAPLPRAPHVDRIVFDLQFTCDTPTLAAILSEIETAPRVAAISRLRIQKVADPVSSGRRSAPTGPTGQLQVSLSAETWVLATPTP